MERGFISVERCSHPSQLKELRLRSQTILRKRPFVSGCVCNQLPAGHTHKGGRVGAQHRIEFEGGIFQDLVNPVVNAIAFAC